MSDKERADLLNSFRSSVTASEPGSAVSIQREVLLALLDEIDSLKSSVAKAARTAWEARAFGPMKF